MVAAVEPAEFWDMGPRVGASAAKSPPELTDSAARESDVTRPGFSYLESAEGSLVTWDWS